MSQLFENNEEIGGAEGARTPDLLAASEALSQLSYGPNLNIIPAWEAECWRTIEVANLACKGKVCFLETNVKHRDLLTLFLRTKLASEV